MRPVQNTTHFLSCTIARFILWLQVWIEDSLPAYAYMHAFGAQLSTGGRDGHRYHENLCTSDTHCNKQAFQRSQLDCVTSPRHVVAQRIWLQVTSVSNTGNAFALSMCTYTLELHMVNRAAPLACEFTHVQANEGISYNIPVTLTSMSQ